MVTGEGKKILYILTKDNRLLFYSLRKETQTLVNNGASITIFKKSTLGELGLIKHSNIKIFSFWPIFFKWQTMWKILVSGKAFDKIYLDDKNFFDSLMRIKNLHRKDISFISPDPGMKLKTLDVGCGGAKSQGAIGIDQKKQEGVDVVCNLNHYPWPFKSDTFDFLYCISVIEHLDNVVKTMEELHRIGKNGSVIVIDTSHFAHPNSYRDPTHKWHFTLGTFDYFTGEVLYPRYSKLKFKMLKKELRFRKKYCTGRLYAFFSTRRYEKYYCHKCPPHSIYFEMEIVKD